MAAAVVTVIIEDFLQSLGNGMKIGQQWGVEHKLIEIRDILSSIRGVLPIAENMYGRSLELQDWVRKLKVAAYAAENLLEELSVEEALWKRKRNVRRLLRPIVRLTFGRRMRDALQAVARRLQELIGSDPVNFIRKIPAGIPEVHEAAHAVPLIVRYDREELIRRLLYVGMERDLPVLSVIGDPKIPTMAIREVLSELEVSRHYDVIIWVDASPLFDEYRLARDIIASLTNEVSPEEESVVKEELLLRVGKLLDGRKKYLFILYDLWVRDSEIQRWLRFCSFLEGGANGSKILVTTRQRDMIVSSGHSVYLPGLTRKECRDFLLKTAFKGGLEEIIDPAKLEIIEDMAGRCPESPLLLRALGGYLSLQHDTSDWSSLPDDAQRYDYVLFTLLRGGYPYGHLGPMVDRYNNLPPRIKQCFGLCSLFPRGHSIDQQTLAELWIALGYIKPSNENDQPLEDIAYNYFNRLLMEELFQVKKFDTFGKERSVVLNPDAEELARSVAGWECLALGKRDAPTEGGLNTLSLRHISIINYPNFNCFFFNLTRMRTVIYSVGNSQTDEILCKHVIPGLKWARVLDVHEMKVEAVPEDVWKLKHLRYLNLSDNRRIETLPPEITNLLNLQTLKLSGCWALKELPKDMRKMVALRHLYIDGCRKLCLMPKRLGDLKFLNILTDFILPPDDSSSVDSANLTDLCKLNDLRGSLRITNLGYFEATRERFKIQGLLDEKSTLETVELKFMNLWTDTSLLEKLQPHPNLKALKIHNYGGTVFPEWMNRPSTHLPNLVEIALNGCENIEYLPQFGQMRHLKSLTTQGLPDLLCMESGSYVDDNTHPFGELSSLCIRDCPKLENLPFIPHLAKLTLVNVSNQLFGHPFWVACSLKTLRLENIELLHNLSKEWLREPTSLEELHIRNCPNLNCLSLMMPYLMKLTLANVDEELFKQPCRLPRLKTLHLENIELLDHLPEHWLQDLTCLKELHIGSCPLLVSLSRGMMHLENLESLSIWDCKNLDLSKDEQDNVMMDLQGLKSLKFLTIYKTLKMEYLPEWLSRVYTLRFLFIRSCPNLVALPEWIGNLRSLKLIELVHCPQLTSLPAGMHEFTDDYPRKLSIIGCPFLQSKGIKHSCKL